MEPITNFETQNSIVKNPRKKIFKIILLVSIILIIAGITIPFTIKKIKIAALNAEIKNSRPADNSISQEEYNKWTIFNNPEMKYTLRYPQNWTLEKISSEQVFLYSQSRFEMKSKSSIQIASNIKITIYKSFSELPNNSETNLNLESWVKFQEETIPAKKIIINDQTGYEITYSYPTRIIYIQKGDLIYSIFDSSAGQNAIQQQIINSLEFN